MNFSTDIYVFPQKDVEMLEKIRVWVSVLREIAFRTNRFSDDLTATPLVITKALAKFFSFNYAEGIYAGFQPHSWLVTSTGNIIDVMPLEKFSGQPILVQGRSSLAETLYRQKHLNNHNGQVNICVERVERVLRNSNHPQ